MVNNPKINSLLNTKRPKKEGISSKEKLLNQSNYKKKDDKSGSLFKGTNLTTETFNYFYENDLVVGYDECGLDFSFSEKLIERLKGNSIINYNPKNYNLLRKILRNKNFKNNLNSEIIFFDDELVLGLLRSVDEYNSDNELIENSQKMLSYLIFSTLELDKLRKRSNEKNKNYKIIFSLENLNSYLSKTIIRFFSNSYKFCNKILQNNINNLDFIFLSGKEIKPDIKVFLDSHDFQDISLEKDIIYEIYNNIKNKISNEVKKYFIVYNIPQRDIVKYLFSSAENEINKKETLRKFLIKENNLDIFEKDISKEEFKKINDNLLEKVKGQDFNIMFLIKSFYNYMKTTKFTKPFVSFFSGSTGVGKTYFAKTLANELGRTFIKKNMNTFSEEHSSSVLLGAPAGYAGYGNKTLVDELKGNNHSVILFDEIEKAHPKVLESLFSLLDEGVLTDRKGQSVLLKGGNIILFTSNIFTSIDEVFKRLKGSTFQDQVKIIYDNLQKNQSKYIKLKSSLEAKKDLRKNVLDAQQSFSNILKKALVNSNQEKKGMDDAFINRIRNVLFFHPIIDEEVIEEISKLEINKMIEKEINEQIISEYKNIWEKHKNIIIKKFMNDSSVRNRGGREIENILPDIIRGYMNEDDFE